MSIEKELLKHIGIKTKSKRRDFQIHIAGLIAPNVDNRPIIGEKDKEIFYQAVQYSASEAPVSVKDVQASFTKLFNLLIQEMNKHGLIKY